ncbi:hypothetical protein OOT08_15280, partial [Leucobacter sp. M11]|nr:hypothetical protein [Leucobacter sp. M11]
ANEIVDHERVPQPGAFLNYWKKSPGTLLGQPFSPSRTGLATSLTVLIAALPPEVLPFAGAAVHAFPDADNVGTVSPTPIAGGVGVVSPAGSPPVDGNSWVTVTFPDRPLLSSAERYLLVIDANDGSGGTVSVPITFADATDPNRSSFLLEQNPGGSWAEAGTMVSFLSLRMAGPITPPAPTVDEPLCDVEKTLTLPDAGEDVRYEVTEAGTERTVVAVAAPGVSFAEGAVTEWRFDLAATPCGVVDPEPDVIVTPLAPSFTEPSCSAAGTVTLPTQEGVVFAQGDADGVTHVTATPEPGYALAEGAVAAWSASLGQLSCVPVDPGTPGPGQVTTPPPGTPGPGQLAQTGQADSGLGAGAVAAAVLALLAGGWLLRRRPGAAPRSA